MVLQKILVIYPEVEFTKIAVYQNKNLLFLKMIRHKPEILASFSDIVEQQDMRTEAILKELDDNDIHLNEIGIVMARGGLIKPVPSGIFKVNEEMKRDLRIGVQGVHETNLGGLIADAIAQKVGGGVSAYLADPVVVDELDEVARITGHPEIQRKSVFHALNQKFVSREYAHSVNRNYEDMNLIVVYVGTGGISVGAHKQGRVVDVNQAFDGGGPFSFTRTGGLPVGRVVDLCYSGKYTREEMRNMVTKNGGLKAYLGTTNIAEIEERIQGGDEYAEFILYAMGYQLSKEIGAMCMVFEERPDAIIMMGAIFNSRRFSDYVTRRAQKVAPVIIYPVVNDMDALASNGLKVMEGKAVVLEYK
jgi:butyrate kinase